MLVQPHSEQVWGWIHLNSNSISACQLRGSVPYSLHWPCKEAVLNESSVLSSWMEQAAKGATQSLAQITLTARVSLASPASRGTMVSWDISNLF